MAGIVVDDIYTVPSDPGRFVRDHVVGVQRKMRSVLLDGPDRSNEDGLVADQFG